MSGQNDIEKLRGHLFETLDALRDKDSPMDIERAKAVCKVSDVIISSAKAEIDFARVNGSVDSQFFKKPVPGAPMLTEKPVAETSTKGTTTVEHGNGYRIITHKAK